MLYNVSVFFLYLFVCSIAQRTETLAWVRKLLFESLRGEMAQIETTAKMNEMSCETTGFEYIGVEIRVNENANAYVLMCDVFICKMVFLYVLRMENLMQKHQNCQNGAKSCCVNAKYMRASDQV